MTAIARLSFRVRYAIITSTLACFMTAAISIVYINYVDHRGADRERRNDQQWCELVTFYDDYYTKTPPATELQRQQASLMHKRRISLGCPIT